MRAFRRHVGRSVTVHLDDGDSIRGTLIDDVGEALTFTDATLYGRDTIPLDGTVIVPSARVRWAQVV